VVDFVARAGISFGCLFLGSFFVTDLEDLEACNEISQVWSSEVFARDTLASGAFVLRLELRTGAACEALDLPCFLLLMENRNALVKLHSHLTHFYLFIVFIFGNACREIAALSSWLDLANGTLGLPLKILNQASLLLFLSLLLELNVVSN